MFEATRKDLVSRLGDLMERFDAIIKEAIEWESKSRQAERLGVNLSGPDPIFAEIQSKASEQLALCGESITLLLRDRSLPLLFKKGVKKAEAFATQCEQVLQGLAEAEAVGKAAFRERFGSR